MEQDIFCQVLESRGSNNVVVFVRRGYGSSHLDPKRFQIIKQCAAEAINKYIKKVVSDLSGHQAAENVGYSTLEYSQDHIQSQNTVQNKHLKATGAIYINYKLS